jgi:Erg28 like protein
VTPLTSRLFGTYTLLAGLIRAYAAYDLSNPTSYALTFWTFVTAMLHFTSEGLLFKTAGIRTGAFPTYVVSIVGTAWMWWCWDEYVR